MRANIRWTWGMSLAGGLLVVAGCGVQDKVAKSGVGQALQLSDDGETNDDGKSGQGEENDGEMDDANEKALESASIKLSGTETAADRQALAKVTPEAAQATALEHVAGTVASIDLDDENGYLVYSVDITKDGASNDVKIDAGDGKFLYIDSAPDSGGEHAGE